MIFAVIEAGGKQYKVSPEQKLKIEKVEGAKDAILNFDKVLLVADGENVKIGTPYVKDAKVEAQILKQGRDKKKIVFRYHSKTRYRKKKGHRQRFTEIQILDIEAK
jgi:large subunit ribosomal protein L21